MAEQHREPANSPRVLFVDDEPIIRDAIVTFLRARGARVIAATSAVTALNILGRRNVDILVSDIQMPTRDGFWLIREVRSKPSFRSLPAIAFTSLGSEHRQRILDAGFSEHIVKDNPHGLWLTIQALRRRAAG